MMLQQQGVGVPPGLLGNSGDEAAAASAAAAAVAAAHQAHHHHHHQESGGGGVGGSFSEEERGRMEEGERNSGGNRWPRQETMALLKIRSDMDSTFRDSSLKGPLWDEVSRKLSELGYHRSAKKCKEKFENVFKYHKRTKDGRTSKADGKTYRFFDQLQALDTQPPPPAITTTMTFPAASPHHPQLPAPLHAQPVSTMPAVTQMANTASVPIVSQVSTTVPSISMNPMITISQSQTNPAPVLMNPTSVAMPIPVSSQPMLLNHHQFTHPNISGSMVSGSTSSSSTSSDSEPPERRGKKRKRKWKDFFGRLMKEVIDKQEELQMKFLDTLEKRERERMIREEAWRAQEIAKMNREHDLLVQERSIAAAKDAAVISFLQKITEQQNAHNPGRAPILPQLPVQIQVQESTQQPPQPPPPAPQVAPVVQQQPPPPPPPQPQIPQSQAVAAVVPVPALAPPAQTLVTKNMVVAKTDNGGVDVDMLAPSPSRWPKVEIQALIQLRTTLDMKYQDNSPKGPLWEEISLSMRKLGYNRNAKRCKEKWENINKYYKKVKESSKKRPEDSKTCPYFHLLDAIYREKGGKTDAQFNQMAPIMAQPEQQWPLPQDQQQRVHQQQRMDSAMDIDQGSQNHDDDDDDEEEEEEGGGYEIVTNTNNKASSMAT